MKYQYYKLILIENCICEKQVRWNEMWLSPATVILQVLWLTAESLLHGEDGFFCALIKYMFKTDLQKNEIWYTKDFLSICKSLPLNAAKKFKIKK